VYRFRFVLHTRVGAAVLLLALTPAPETALIFRVSTVNAPSSTVLAETKAVLAARLRNAGIGGTVNVDGNHIVARVRTSEVASAKRILSARGVFVLRIYPKGETYAPKVLQPITHARVTSDVVGQPAITLDIVNPSLFHEFSRHHLNQRLGIYMDDKLIIAPDIVAPLSRSVMISGNLGNAMWAPFVSIVNSGPLPVPLQFVGDSIPNV
jgi:hypothetical protein